MLSTPLERNSDEFIFSPLTQSDAAAMLDWRYEPPYDIYNLASTNPDERKETIAYLLDPEHNFHLISSPNGRVVGFCSFGLDAQVPGGDYSQPALDIGLGLHPVLTGKGLGRSVVGAVLNFAGSHFQPERFRVTIAAFNKRAQCVWQQHGFRPVQRFVAKTGAERPFIIFTL